jgi:hypothetical protein
MRERLIELRIDVLGLMHRAAQAGDYHATWVLRFLWEVLGLVLESRVV